MAEGHHQSQALQDEIEATNAIYGDKTLTPTSTAGIYILVLPFHTTSLRLSFPADYPDTEPSILGPESSLKASLPSSVLFANRKGDAAQFADLARQVLHSCFQPGSPCIFDLIEELKSELDQRDYAEANQDTASLSSDFSDSSETAEAGYASDTSFSGEEKPHRASATDTTGRATSGLAKAATGTANVLYNALIRTHHVTSRKKVGKVKKMAHHELRYLLIRSGGSPGLMYAEGDEESLQGWIAGVSNLRYKDYQLLRAPAPLQESQMLQRNAAEKARSRDAAGKKAAATEDLAGYEEVDSVAHFAERIEKRGVLRWWRQAMGYEESDRIG